MKGTGCYVLDKSVWEAIGKATALSGSTIPSAYGPRVPNVSMDRSKCLQRCGHFGLCILDQFFSNATFKDVKYFKHFVHLVALLNLCLQFEISTAEIRLVREGFHQLGEDYERYIISI